MQDTTISDLIKLIAQLTTESEAEIAFQRLVAAMGRRFTTGFNAQCARKNIMSDSPSIETIYDDILQSLKSDIRMGKFPPHEHDSDASLLTHTIGWTLKKIPFSVSHEYRRNKRQVRFDDSLIDLSEDADDDNQQQIDAMLRALEMLSVRDQRILRVFYLVENLSEDEKRSLLMKELNIPTKNAFSKAKTEAIHRLRKLLDKPKRKE